MSKIKIIILTFIAVAMIFAVAAFYIPLGTNISRQEAVDIAVEHVGGGRTNRPEIDLERFQRVWSVEVFYDGLVHEVYISTRTGAIIAHEIDR